MRIYLLLLFLVFLPSSSFSSFFHFLFFSSFLIRLFFPTYQMTNKRQKDWTIFIELFDSFYLFTRANYFKYYTVTGGSYRCTTILRKIVLLFFFSFPPSIVFFPSFSFFPSLPPVPFCFTTLRLKCELLSTLPCFTDCYIGKLCTRLIVYVPLRIILSEWTVEILFRWRIDFIKKKKNLA